MSNAEEGKKIKNRTISIKSDRLLERQQAAGSYNIYWPGRDNAGAQAATGTYLIVMKTIEGTKIQKAVTMR